MAQNIYDDPGFFEDYSRLGRPVEGLAGAAEWPALRGCSRNCVASTWWTRGT